jgi:hypothetical protein
LLARSDPKGADPADRRRPQPKKDRVEWEGEWSEEREREGTKRKALGKRDTDRRRLVVDRDFAESAPLLSELLSAKSLFADRLLSALGKEPFAERLTWRSAKEALCRVSTRQLSAKIPALGKVGFSCSVSFRRQK